MTCRDVEVMFKLVVVTLCDVMAEFRLGGVVTWGEVTDRTTRGGLVIWGDVTVMFRLGGRVVMKGVVKCEGGSLKR